MATKHKIENNALRDHHRQQEMKSLATVWEVIYIETDKQTKGNIYISQTQTTELYLSK